MSAGRGATDSEPKVRLAAPEITDEDRAQVCDALSRPQISYGEIAKGFEGAVARLLRRQFALATVSGTAAIHLALLSVGVEPEDLVLMPSLTFVAPAHAARYAGADPLLFDAEPEYRQIDVGRLAEWLDSNCKVTDRGAVEVSTGRRIGAVVAVDLLGHPCDIASLKALTEPLDLPIVEDAAQALGALREGKPIGCGARAVCLSFNANKTITTAGGGMLLTDDEGLIENAEFLANQAKADKIEYVHTAVGFNYRMPAAPAALGLSQLARLGEILARKRGVARFYRESLADVPGLLMPRQAPWARAVDWLTTVQVSEEEFGLDSRALVRALESRGVEARPIFTPLHETGVYEHLDAHYCGVASKLGSEGVSLPSSITLDESDLSLVAEAIDDSRRRRG